MKRFLPVPALLAFASLSFADMPRPTEAVQEPIAGHADGGATGMCSVVYYDHCSGWVWIWEGSPQSWSGVVFDLPRECGKLPGESCSNTHFWFYWRFTSPGRMFVNYRAHEVDSSNCLLGEPLLEIDHYSPTERWNYHSGFGETSADRVAIVSQPYWGSWPRISSDHNVRNQGVGCGTIPVTARSFLFVDDDIPLCPPVPYQDPLGPVNLLVEAGFDCEATATEPSSWSGVKQMFQ